MTHQRPSTVDPVESAERRTLSPFEKIFWRFGQAAPMCVTVMARVGGVLKESVLRAALDRVQQRHPLLRVRIEIQDGIPVFRGDRVPKIPLRVVRSDANGLRLVVEDEINKEFDLQRGPLFRCVMVERGQDEADLLVTFDHVVGDAMSGIYLIRDVLSAAQSILEQKESSRVETFTDSTPMDLRLPESVQGMAGWYRRACLIAGVLQENLKLGAPASIRADHQSSLGERRTKLVSHEFEPTFVSALVQRSRREETTVHGALSAAICLGVAHDTHPTKPLSIKHRCPVNVRDQLDPVVGEDVGMFASMVLFRGRVTAQDDFWTLARKIRSQLKSGIDRGQPALMASMLPRLYRTLGGDKLPLATLVQRWLKQTRSTSGLTNVGRLDIQPDYGPLRLHSMQYAVSPGAIGDFACTAATYGDRLFLNLMCPEPTIGEQRRMELSEGIIQRLRAAVNADA